MNRVELISLLKKHEGIRLFPYVDTEAKLTIGIGRNLTDVGISGDEADYMLKNDIDRAIHDLDIHLPWYKNLSENRQFVLIDMCFNLGISKLLKFTMMLYHLEFGNYYDASGEMIDSKWATQVGQRAIELAKMMREG